MRKKEKNELKTIQALNKAYNLGPKAKNAEYIVSIDDFKKGVISVSAILNEHPSATLYFGIKDDGLVVFCLDTNYFEHENPYDTWEHWVKARGGNSLYSKGFLHFLKDYMIEELQRAISPKVEVNFEIQKVGNWAEIYKNEPRDDLDCLAALDYEAYKQMGDIGVVRFNVTGGSAPYSAYGQYYMRKNGKICPLDSTKFTIPEQTKPVINIGPKTKQTVYVETLNDLKEGLDAISDILYKYPYAMIYIGVKQNGTVIEPRSFEDTVADITRNTMDYAFWLANQVLRVLPEVTPTIETFGEANLLRLCISSSYHRVLQRNKINFAMSPSSLYTGTWTGVNTKKNIYELEAPVRDLTFEYIKEQLAQKGIAWEKFESEFGVSLHNTNGNYNLFAGLISDHSECCVEASLVGDIWDMIDANQTLSKQCFLFERINSCLTLLCAYVIQYDEVTQSGIDTDKFFDEFFGAYSYALMHHNWAVLHIPIIETTNDSIDIIFYPNSWEDSIPKFNEALVRLMDLFGIIKGTVISPDELRKKYGPKAAYHESNDYYRISFPLPMPNQQ